MTGRSAGLLPSVPETTIAIDTGRETWTVRVKDAAAELQLGTPLHPEATITTDARTFSRLRTGTQSGVEAFLSGKLCVRGNLSLALRLETLLARSEDTSGLVRARVARAAGIDTFYLEAGSGPTIVLLHGLGATNASMLPTLWDLARDHRVVAPDLPGFGSSGKPLAAYDFPFFARWASAFLDQVDAGRAHLVGNSMGGRIAVETALRYPHQVDRMVLLAPSSAFLRHRQFVPLVRLLRPELAHFPVLITHGRVVEALRGLFAHPERLPEQWYLAAADEFVRVFHSARGRVAFFSCLRQIYLDEPHGENGFWDRLPSLKQPSLFVWGGRDRLVPARFARHVTDRLPKSRSVVLDDCGHVPQYELPDLTHRLTRDFLDSADRRRSGGAAGKEKAAQPD